MNFLGLLAERIDSFNERVGRFVSWITTLLVVVVFVDVVMRYLFNVSFVFTQELGVAPVRLHLPHRRGLHSFARRACPGWTSFTSA